MTRTIPAFLMFLLLATPLAAAPCDDALPLPLDRSLHGSGTTRYVVTVTAPGLLLVEAHGGGAPEVRFLGADCEPRSSNLPLTTMHGRHVHRVTAPGAHYLEIVAEDGSLYRLDAWHVPGRAALLTKDGDPPDDDGGGPREPMDEWDELLFPNGNKALASPAWREIAGHGVLEIVGGRARLHAWCSWVERLELLSTFTCARRLRLTDGGTWAVRPLGVGDQELLGLETAADGRLWVETDGAVYDAEGRLAGELRSSEPVQLTAGRYFLKWTATGSPVRLDFDPD